MANRRGVGLASFIAGFGTSYLKGMNDKAEAERQAKKDKLDNELRDIQIQEAKARLEDNATKRENRQAVEAGLQDIDAMKVGELRDQSGVVDTSPEAFQQRILASDPSISQETAASVAPIYAKAAQEDGVTGSKGWLNNSFAPRDGLTLNPDGTQSAEYGAPAIGDVKQVQQSDIYQAEADAYSKGGVDYRQERMAALKAKADAKYGEGLRHINSWDGGDFTPIKKAYDLFEDGYDIHGEKGDDGKFYTYYTDKDGNKKNRQAWDDPMQFKKEAISWLISPEGSVKTYAQMMKFEDDKYERNRQKIKDDRDKIKFDQEQQVFPLQLQTAEANANVAKVKSANAAEEARLGLQKDKADLYGKNLDNTKKKQENSGNTLDLTEQKKINDLVDETSQIVASTIEQTTGKSVGKSQSKVPSGQYDEQGNAIMTGKTVYKVTPELRQQIHTLTMNGIEQPEIISILGKRDAKGNSTALGISGDKVGIMTSKGFLPLRNATKSELDKTKR